MSSDGFIGRGEIHDIMALVAQFEEKLGKPHSILEPFDFINLDNAVELLSKHLGIERYNYILKLSDEFDSPKTSGTYKYNKTKPNDVIICVRSDLNNFGILETLCHELTHHHMNVNGTRETFKGVTDEVATDYMMIYLGLGKIALNGTKQCYNNSDHWLGYVDFTRMNIMYRLICKLGGVSDNESYTNLRPLVQAQLAYVDNTCSEITTVDYYETYRATRKTGFFDTVIEDIKSFFGL